MKKNKTLHKIILGTTSIVCIATSALPLIHAESTVNDEAIRKDLYQAVNQEWIDKQEITDEKPTVSTFDQLEKNVNDHLKQDMKDLSDGKIKPNNEEEKKWIQFNKIANNFEQRDKEGFDPAKPYLEKIDQLKSVKHLQGIAKEWALKRFSFPANFSIEQDGKDATKNALCLRMPFPMLETIPGEEAMMKQKEEGFINTATKLLTMTGEEEATAKDLASKALAFNNRLSKYINEDATTQAEAYNPKTLEEINAYSKNLNFGQLFEELVGEPIQHFNVEDAKYYEAFDEIINDKNLEEIKAWMKVSLVMETADLTSKEATDTMQKFNETVLGDTTKHSMEEIAFEKTNSTFGHVAGNFYGKKYFGDDNKEKATQMVKEMIGIYKERLKNNDWLSNETKTNAIKKLDTMGIQVGYPDDYKQEYKDYKIDESKSLFDNYNNFTELSRKLMYQNINKPAAKDSWNMAGYTVNAYYDPSCNKVVLPAAIFQAPFYDENRSMSANYGAIGAIIGHELSHSFDTNGAQYDENGNLKSWWNKKDYAEFEKRTQAMVEEWDGQPYAGGNVDGKTTLAENIADNGGLTVALEATKRLKDPDFKEFFKSWASVWATKESPEYSQFTLQGDLHAPKPLRANIQAQNMPEFYEAFGVKEGDDMYRAPEKRVQIW